MDKKQILVIHGGDYFDTYADYIDFLRNYELSIEKLTGNRKWKDNLGSTLGNEYELLSPMMPSKYNAKYTEWKIWMEKIIPFLRNDVILIGHSMGGIFLVKYLSESELPIKIKSTILIAAPFDDEDSEYSLGDFSLPDSIELFKKQSGKIIFYQSKDDPIVPFSDIEKYSKNIPDAEVNIFENKEHFNQEEFPELIDKIKSLDIYE